MDDLQAEVAYKVKQLQVSQAREPDLVAHVESLRKQLEMLKNQSAKVEGRALKVDELAEKTKEEAAFLKQLKS